MTPTPGRAATRWIHEFTTILTKITPVTTPAEPEPAPARIAVAIPCFNEAAAIAAVIAQFRGALPAAELIALWCLWLMDLRARHRMRRDQNGR